MKIKLISAASASYSQNLLALIGSLNLNWPNHPPIEIYDIGLDTLTLEKLQENSIVVKQVPPFCPHWRKHFTWKIWCWNDVDADIFLYMDAGILVMKPLDDILEVIEKIGYAVFPNYRSLEEEASVNACKGCGLDPDFRKGKSTLAGGLIGFNKNKMQMRSMISELFELALDENNLKASLPTHRHDQALMSLMFYKNVTNPLMLDGNIYLGDLSPIKVPGQRVWACRKNVEIGDIQYFQNYLTGTSIREPYIPQTPSKTIFGEIDEFAYQMNRVYGKNKADLAQMMLKKYLGRSGSLILKSLLMIINTLRQILYGNKKIQETTPYIYDGIKDK